MQSASMYFVEHIRATGAHIKGALAPWIKNISSIQASIPHTHIIQFLTVCPLGSPPHHLPIM
jgi:hypothetical protein